MDPQVYTYSDALEALSEFIAGQPTSTPQTRMRMALEAAYRELFNARDWSFLRKSYRINLQGALTTGYAAFDLTGGAYERLVTLSSSGTFPTDAADWSIKFSDPDLICDVEEYKTSTTATLTAGTAPSADISAQSYTLFPRWYRLPNDFGALYRPLFEDTNWQPLTKVSLEEIAYLNRTRSEAGTPSRYAIGPTQDLYGSIALQIHPPVSADHALDILYKKRMRTLRYTGHESTESQGTITVTAGSATVTGTSTAFASSHVGSILRIGTDGTNRPTGFSGKYPYGEQRVINSYTSSTEVTLDANVATSQTDVAYTITDPIDLDAVCYDAFLRSAERHLARSLGLKNQAEFQRAYREAFTLACEADCRDLGPQQTGAPVRRTQRLKWATSREVME